MGGYKQRVYMNIYLYIRTRGPHVGRARYVFGQ